MTPGQGFDPRPVTADPPLAEAGSARLLASGYQGAVYLTETPAGPVIVKKAMGRGVVYAARRAMLRREHAIYERLAGIRGVPVCHGLEHGDQLVLGYLDGSSLRQLKQSAAEREQFFSSLLELIQAIHRAGVAHGDLKRKDNILVGRDGLAYVIDFGTAVAAPPGCSTLRHWTFDLLRRIDLNAWFKLKYQGGVIPVAPADLRYYRPTLPERLARVVRESWRRVTLRRWRKARR
jgi:predicted Ser/Thr protein kinase